MRADIYTTLKASPLSNRGYERSEHPRLLSVDGSTVPMLGGWKRSPLTNKRKLYKNSAYGQ